MVGRKLRPLDQSTSKGPKFLPGQGIFSESSSSEAIQAVAKNRGFGALGERFELEMIASK